MRTARQPYLARKGATPEMIVALDNALAQYARVIARDLDIDVLNLAGGGAWWHGGRAVRFLRRAAFARVLNRDDALHPWPTRWPMRIW